MNEQVELSVPEHTIPDDIISILSSNGMEKDSLLLKKVTIDRLCQLIMSAEYSIDDLCKIFGVSRYALTKELNNSDILSVIATYMRVGIINDIKNYNAVKSIPKPNGNDGEFIDVPDMEKIRLADMMIKRKIEIANGFAPIKHEKENLIPTQDINIITIDSDDFTYEDESISLHENPNGFVEEEEELNMTKTSEEEQDKTIKALEDMLNPDTGFDL